MIEEYLELGATHAAAVSTESIRIAREFRSPCEMNQCGHYDKNWTCPPGIGGLEECEKRSAVSRAGCSSRRYMGLKVLLT